MSAQDDFLKKLNSYIADPSKAAKDVQTGYDAAKKTVAFAQEYGDDVVKYATEYGPEVIAFLKAHGNDIVGLVKDPYFKTFIGTVKQIQDTRKKQAAGLGAADTTTSPSAPTTMFKLNKYATAYLWYLNHKVLAWSLAGVGVAGIFAGGYLLGKRLRK